MRISSNLQGIFKDSRITFLYKKIDSGIPFRQIANQFDKTEQEIKEIFNSKEYKQWRLER